MTDDSLVVVEAEERLDRVAFNPLVEWTDHMIEVGGYTCPHCRTETVFNTGTLRQFERQEVSPLGSDWHRRCEAVRPVGTWEWAMDFRCRGCDRAVRMIYSHDGEYAMSAYKYRVLHIIEESAAR